MYYLVTNLVTYTASISPRFPLYKKKGHEFSLARHVRSQRLWDGSRSDLDSSEIFNESINWKNLNDLRI